MRISQFCTAIVMVLAGEVGSVEISRADEAILSQIEASKTPESINPALLVAGLPTNMINQNQQAKKTKKAGQTDRQEECDKQAIDDYVAEYWKRYNAAHEIRLEQMAIRRQIMQARADFLTREEARVAEEERQHKIAIQDYYDFVRDQFPRQQQQK